MFLERISDLSYLVTALFARGRRTGQKNELRFVVGFSRRTGTARGFRDRIPVEGAEHERSGWEPAQKQEITEIMILDQPVKSRGTRLQHGRCGGHLRNRGGVNMIIANEG